jgi:hypothetical protein
MICGHLDITFLVLVIRCKLLIIRHVEHSVLFRKSLLTVRKFLLPSYKLRMDEVLVCELLPEPAGECFSLLRGHAAGPGQDWTFSSAYPKPRTSTQSV